MVDSARSAERRLAWVLGLVVTVLWGVSFVATRVAVAEVPPLVLAFIRFAIAVVVLGPWLARDLRAVGWRWRDQLAFAAVGFTGVTLAFVFENLGLARTTAAHGSLIVATTPLATAVTEALVRRVVPPGRTLVGLVLAFAGTALIIGQPAAADGATLVGDLLMLCTVVVWVVYSLQVARLSETHTTGRITNLAILWGVVTLLPLAAAEAWTGELAWPSPAALVSILFLGVACSALAYLWWNRALQVLGVTATNSLIYCVPLVAVAAGVLLLDEPLTVAVVAGGAMVIGGVALANLKLPRTPRRLPGG